MNRRRDILLRIYLIMGFIVLFSVLIVVYAADIMFVDGDKWKSLSKRMTTSYQTIEAVRGNIYAQDGSLLATSIPIYELRVDFNAPSKEAFNEGLDSLAYLFSKKFKDKSEGEYRNQFRTARRNKNRYFLLKRKLSFTDVKEMKTWPILRLGRYKGGLIVIEKVRRKKPYQLLAERTIGYSIPGVAPVGLEGSFDSILAGVGGQRLMQKIAGGEFIPINDRNEIEPEDGKDIYTTIDINLQDVAEDALMDALVNHDAQDGCAVLMEVETGEIRAIANLKRKSEGVYTEEYNYAVGESAEPGSTFKLVSMMALLDNDLADLDDSVTVDGGVTRYFDREMKDSEPHNYNMMSLKTSFERSSNVGISKLVYKHFSKQPEKFIEFIKSLGLHKPLGLQISGEGRPKVKHPDDKDWYGTTLPWMSMGYEIRVTPLQILAVYNAVANKGKMVKPLFVTSIRSSGKIIEKYKTEVIKEQICKESTLKKCHEALLAVVEKGTATSLKNENYLVAGKTGTALIADAKRGYRKFYKSSFVGYFPADNPKYTCIVSINGASKGVYYGAAVAGPVFKSIADKVYAGNLEWQTEKEAPLIETKEVLPLAKAGYRDEIKLVLNRLGLPSYTQESESEPEWVGTYKENNTLKLSERKLIDGLVPNVEGMSLKDAVYLLENRGLKVKSKGHGRVRKQSISPGARIYKGNTIYLELS